MWLALPYLPGTPQIPVGTPRSLYTYYSAQTIIQPKFRYRWVGGTPLFFLAFLGTVRLARTPRQWYLDGSSRPPLSFFIPSCFHGILSAHGRTGPA